MIDLRTAIVIAQGSEHTLFFLGLPDSAAFAIDWYAACDDNQ
jgi:hypothetical protein